MCGAGGVALFSMVFAWVADVVLRWNAQVTAHSPWLAFVMLPCGLAALRWLTLRFAAQAQGSGIPRSLLPSRYRRTVRLSVSSCRSASRSGRYG